MTPVVLEWVEKAEEDWGCALRERKVTPLPACSVVCFHAQQCAEKYLKAVLVDRKTDPPKIHDLVRLRKLVVPLCPGISQVLTRRFASLSRAAVEYRYPGGQCTRRIADASVRTAEAIRAIVRAALGMK